MPKFYQVSRSGFTFKEYGYSEFGEYVYGPFKDFEELDADVIKRVIDKDKVLLVFDAEIRPVARSPKEKPENEKRAPGDEKNWKKVSDDPIKWECKTCGATIMAATVAHPIWDGPFPGSGSGECEYEKIGYCPNCEKQPNFSGTPITPR